MQKPFSVLFLLTLFAGNLRSQDLRLDSTLWNADNEVYAYCVDSARNILYIGGSFSAIGTNPRDRIAAIDLASGIPTFWSPAAPGTVRTIAIKDSFVYVGCSNGALGKYHAYTGQKETWGPVANGAINTLYIKGNVIYVGGRFTEIGSVARNRIAVLDTDTALVALWNPGANNDVNIIRGSGDVLYVGGNFTQIAGTARNRIGAFNISGGDITAWNPIANGAVYDILPVNNTIYVGGDFFTIGGGEASGLASINPTSGQLVSSWYKYSARQVKSMCYNNGIVYTGGNYGHVQAGGKNGLVAIDGATGMPTAWNPHITDNSMQGLNSYLNVVTFSGNTLYAGGKFIFIGDNKVTYSASFSPPKYKLNKDSIGFSKEGGQNDFSIETSESWVISDTSDWITTSIDSGNGNAVVVVTVAPNPSYQPRFSFIFVKIGTSVEKVKIFQQATPFVDSLALDNDSLFYERTGGGKSLTISSNTSWVLSGNASWINVAPSSGSGNATVSVTVSANTGFIERSTAIFVTAGSIVKKVVVFQEAMPDSSTLSLNDDTLIYENQEDTKTVAIQSNTDWSVSISAGWVKANLSNGNGNTELEITVESNEGFAERQAQVLITTGSLSRVLVIIQKGSTVGVIETDLINQVKVYPNPLRGEFNIRNDSDRDLMFTVLNIHGQAITAQEKLPGNSIVRKRVIYPAGVYFVHIENYEVNEYIKLIVID